MRTIYVTILPLLFMATFSIAQDKSIEEERFVSVGGIEQWVTINGDDRTKPIILFIHGGPGSTMSQFDNAMYNGWEREFVLVNWDQRGAGRTYGHDAPVELTEEYLTENPLTVAQMTKDGIELTRYLIDYLQQEKIILVGTSWGSILGIEMALSNPELFYAYLGHAQFVNFSENINYAYKKVYNLAERGNDQEVIEQLHSLGKPPYDNAKNYGQLLRVVKQYERKSATPAPDAWFALAPAYDNEKDSKNRYDGDDYSFINLVGHKKLGIKSMVAEVDFSQDGLEFEIPVYLIQGAEDILTATEINKPYFDKIAAPDKEYFLLPDAAHGHNQSVVDQQYKVVTEYISFE
ncbi:MAG: alpha/beta hydrolase [Bacteroidota bacterium]